MNEEQKMQSFNEYNKNTHRIGRISCIITLILLLGAPFVIGLYLGAMPDFKACLRGFLAIGTVYLVSCIAEYLVYVPMLGAGGSYLGFITGNLLNMKIPAAITARDIVGAKSGTPENEIISTLSIATSSLVTIIVLAVGVILLQPLQPLLQSPVLQPAFDNILPALFGAMACKYYRGNMRVAIFPFMAMTLLFTLLPSLTSATSFMIIPSGAIAIGLAYFFFRRDAQKLGKEDKK